MCLFFDCLVFLTFVSALRTFIHSILASGDPLEDAVIIWTRYTPENADDEIDLEFRMAAVDPDLKFEDHLDPANNPNIRRGFVTVTSASGVSCGSNQDGPGQRRRRGKSNLRRLFLCSFC